MFHIHYFVLWKLDTFAIEIEPETLCIGLLKVYNFDYSPVALLRETSKVR